MGEFKNLLMNVMDNIIADNVIRSRYFKIYNVESFYYGDLNVNITKEYLSPYDGEIISFTIPPNITDDKSEIYIDWDYIGDTGLSYMIIYGRCYIYGTGIGSYSTSNIKILYYENTPYIKTSLSGVSGSYFELNTNRRTYYLIGGDFITKTLSEYIFDYNYNFSDYVLGIKNNNIYLLNVEKINDHVLRIEDHVLYSSFYDDIYFYVHPHDNLYYKNVYENYSSYDTPTKRTLPTEINNLFINGIQNYKEKDLKEVIKNNDYGLYDSIKNTLGAQKKYTFKIRDLDIITSHEDVSYFNLSKIDFNSPKYHMRIYNPTNKKIELFFNGLLFTKEKTIIQKGGYTHIYVGAEQLNTNLNRRFLLGEDIIPILNDHINESDMFTINLKRQDYIYEHYPILPLYDNYVYLNNNHDSINEKKVYLDGRLLKASDYEISLNGDKYMFFCKVDIYKPSILTITGYTESITITEDIVSYTRLLEKNNIKHSEIYYKGYFIDNSLLDNISTNIDFINVDSTPSGDFIIYEDETESDPTSFFDYRDELIESGYYSLNPIEKTLDDDTYTLLPSTPYTEDSDDLLDYQIVKSFAETGVYEIPPEAPGGYTRATFDGTKIRHFSSKDIDLK